MEGVPLYRLSRAWQNISFGAEITGIFRLKQIWSGLALRLKLEPVGNNPYTNPQMVNLNIDTLFVDIGALIVEIFVLNLQIDLHLQTGAFRLWPKLQPRCFKESPQG